MAKKKLGELLLEEELITEAELENALEEQKGSDKKIGKILIEKGLINDVQIAEILTKQLSLPLIDCSSYLPTEEIYSILPRDIAEKNLVLPIEKDGNSLLVAMANPLDWQTIEELSFRTNLKVKVGIASENDIITTLKRLYGDDEEADETWDVLKELPSYDGVEFVKEKDEENDHVNLGAMFKNSEAPPIVRLVTMIIANAVEMDASDIHIEPRERNVQVRYRIDGALKDIQNYPKQIQEAVISRVKIISNLDITNRRFPQDGRSTLRLENKNIDLRISTLPSSFGEKIVIRLLDPIGGLLTLDELGISDHVLDPLVRVFNQPQGMLLVTGPTGSGKTTTLYSILQRIINETKNIITLEDPVEYKLQGITQVGINEGIGFTFASALRSVLRQDPDIVMLGEIRDLETAEIATRASLTGHLVLSTLHTNDTVATITRLIDIGLEPFLVTSAVSGVLAQRLIRRVCPDCKVKVDPPEEVEKFNLPPVKMYFRGRGCSKCNNTGYKGRLGVYEFLQIKADLKKMIAKQASGGDLWQAALKGGMKTMFHDAWMKVSEGLTTVEEVFSKVPFVPIDIHDPADFEGEPSVKPNGSDSTTTDVAAG